MKIRVGEQFKEIQIENIIGETVNIPSENGKFIHLQFRRFSGCPICNLHIQDFIRQKAILDSENIQEVIFFHSSKENLIEYQGQFPFHIVADPEKKFYKQYGVEKSVFSILHPMAFWAAIKGNFKKDNPKIVIENGVTGLPAEFLIRPDGKVIAVNYGKHAYDQWSISELLQKKM